MKVLLIAHCSFSHIASALKVLDILDRNGYQITICSSASAENILEKLDYNYEIVHSQPFGFGFESVVTKDEKYAYFQDLLIRYNDVYYENRKRDLSEILQKEQPNIILLDSLYATDAFILYDWVANNDCSLVQLTMMPSLNRTLTTPPVHSTLIPTSSKEVSKAWRWYNFKRRCIRLKNQIKYLGYDDVSIVQDKVNSNQQFKEDHPIVWMDHQNIRFDNIPEIVVIPKEYEFQPYQPLKGQYFIGFNFFERNEETLNTNNYRKISDLIDHQKKQGKQLIYCSFGSIYQNYKEKAEKVTSLFIQAMESMPDYFAIISIKSEESKGIIQNLPKNVFIYDFVPQLKVLSESSAFVTHGGLNSVREAIHYLVPMLVFPMSPIWDQQGNAARVAYHNVGIRGDLGRENLTTMKSKLTKLLTEDAFHKKLENMKAIDATYTEDRFLTLLQQLSSVKPQSIEI